MAVLVGHDAFELHEKTFGHPSHPLPLLRRVELVGNNEEIPVQRAILSIITPPSPGTCCHCGAPCGSTQNVRQHAVAGMEWARHPESRDLLRFVVTHCDRCLGSDACSSDEITPGSGASEGPSGFCRPMPSEETVGISLFPGARYASKFAGFAIGALAAWLMANCALVLSQGQQQSDLKGDTGSLGAQGDSTSGHGFNGGALKVYTGSAPATGNSAESGTLLINWALPNPCFGSPSAALPSVLTANAISNVAAVGTGTANYGRMLANGDDGLSSTTERRGQFGVGTSGADMNFNTLAIVTSATCSCTALSITHG